MFIAVSTLMHFGVWNKYSSVVFCVANCHTVSKNNLNFCKKVPVKNGGYLYQSGVIQCRAPYKNNDFPK